MERAESRGGRLPRSELTRRITIWAFIIAVPWVPGAVALAMILSGHAGR